MPTNSQTLDDADLSAPEKEQAKQAEQDENLAVNALLKEYKEARQFDADARKIYHRDRTAASGRLAKMWASTANIIGAFIDILVSFLYARDPEVTVLPAKVVGDTNPDDVAFAETVGIVVPKLWKKGRLKKAMRKMVRSSLSIGPGWLKIIMTHETRKDPETLRKLNDLEDNLQRLNAAQVELKEGELEPDEAKVKRQELESLKESLQAKLEVAHRFGLAIDFVRGEDMQVSLDVSDLAEYLDGDWIGNEIFIPQSAVRGRFPRLDAEDMKGIAEYTQIRSKKDTDDSGNQIPEGFNAGDGPGTGGRFQRLGEGNDGSDVVFARVIEVWDNRDNKIKTVIDGVGRWAVSPYPPPYASSRFYPYFYLGFFEVDGERHPQSLSDRLFKLQEEYSSKRSNSRLTAERSVPGTIFDRQGVSDTDMTKIEGSVHQEFVGISPVKGDDIRKLFSEKPVGRADPSVFDTSSVLRDMERISGVQEALSSGVSVAKTATEAKIQDTGFASRTSADRDSVEDVLLEMAEYTTELAIQALTPEIVERMAGPLAFWPHDMDVEDLLTMVELDIKAGSTGKPDEENLRQSWSVLLPLVTQTMTQIQEAQFTGNLPLAESLKNLLRETMRRLDERISIDQFIPEGQLPDLAGVPGLGVVGEPAQQEGEAPVTAEAPNTLV